MLIWPFIVFGVYLYIVTSFLVSCAKIANERVSVFYGVWWPIHLLKALIRSFIHDVLER